ncbi:MAG: TIGR02281 family clan AA aspartic protease [Pseudomonadota bacterium]
MSATRRAKLFLWLILAGPACLQAAEPNVRIEALFKGMAVLTIDGQRMTLRAGEGFAGVTLIRADANEATLQINDQTISAGISEHITAAYEVAEAVTFTIPRDEFNQYQTTALINGRAIRVLVDTGASFIALNGREAAAMGLDYLSGTTTPVQTASGMTQAFLVNLESVSVGGI